MEQARGSVPTTTNVSPEAPRNSQESSCLSLECTRAKASCKAPQHSKTGCSQLCLWLPHQRQTELLTCTSTTLTGINVRIRWGEKKRQLQETHTDFIQNDKIMHPRVLLKLRPKVISSQGTGKQRVSWPASGARNKWWFRSVGL